MGNAGGKSRGNVPNYNLSVVALHQGVSGHEKQLETVAWLND